MSGHYFGQQYTSSLFRDRALHKSKQYHSVKICQNAGTIENLVWKKIILNLSFGIILSISLLSGKWHYIDESFFSICIVTFLLPLTNGSGEKYSYFSRQIDNGIWPQHENNLGGKSFFEERNNVVDVMSITLSCSIMYIGSLG